MDTFRQDLRYSIRSLLQKPGYALIVILTLALGIGANSAIFSFVNALLLTPLPYQDAERLVRIQSQRGNETGMLSLLEIVDLKEQARLFDGFASFRNTQYNITGNGPPEALRAAVVNWNLFELLGVKPLHGATWPASHERISIFEIVLSHDVWQRRFGGDPHIVGQKIMLDAAPYEVLAVMPPGFRFPLDADLYRRVPPGEHALLFRRRQVLSFRTRLPQPRAKRRFSCVVQRRSRRTGAPDRKGLRAGDLWR